MLQTNTMLLGSTGNVTKKTAEYLDKLADNETTNPGPIVYSKGPYGWFIYAGDNAYWDEQLPEDLQNVIDKAHKEKCEWIMLDNDEDSIVGLPFYEW